MSAAQLALKYAGAAGTLLGGIKFIVDYDSMTADEIREDLKKLMERVEAELDKIGE